MRRLWIITLLIGVLVACTPTTPEPTRIPLPTVMPTATATLPAMPDVLDWHVRFSSNQDTELFRCRILPNIDMPPQDLIDPLSVRVSAVWVTPQMLDEIERIYSVIGADALTSIEFLRENPQQQLVLMRIDFAETRDVNAPFRMLLPAQGTRARVLNTLSEIRFRFGDRNFSDSLLWLQVGEDRLLPQVAIDALEAEAGVVYPFFFALDASTASDARPIELVANLELIVPFILDTCELDHYQTFNLTFNQLEGDSLLMSQTLGDDPMSQLADELVSNFRIELLADAIPNVTALLPTSTPTITPAPVETTPEVTESP
ncbi:MAG: hypothetical protein ACFE0Q_03330 [Anaerolineae bacterium]